MGTENVPTLPDFTHLENITLGIAAVVGDKSGTMPVLGKNIAPSNTASARATATLATVKNSLMAVFSRRSGGDWMTISGAISGGSAWTTS
ncbi:MAG: hypothetical protein A3I78_07380 [Gammaproteobacteria bacterium RIFCSPLOWO2_02_FULL_56_15]|nr:MAG: hypothetical protein A3I78_07380 [Gammaproteobacteria bacterium RIFCSPLOWO2_02_FULL_56_15]